MQNAKGISKILTGLIARLDSGGLFGGLSEKAVLNKLLNDPVKGEKFPFVEARDLLVQLNSVQHQQKVQKARLQSSLKPESTLPTPSDQAKSLLQRSAVTSKDLDTFLKTNYLKSISQNELREFVDEGILDMLSASTPNNLRTLMNYLSKYWQVGLFNVRPTISQARSHARALLVKAIDIHPKTVHEGGGEQTGIPDFNKFEAFVDNFFRYMNVERSSQDELNMLLLRLCASSGSIKDVTALVMEKPHIDEFTLKTYLSALSSAHKSADSLMFIKPMLINEHTGPTAVLFMLPYCRSLDDLMFVLETVERSSQKREVYEQCQAQVLHSLNSLDTKYSKLALMFGVLDRIQRCTPLTESALDTALSMALEAQNKSAVKRLVDQSKHTSSEVQRANKYIQS